MEPKNIKFDNGVNIQFTTTGNIHILDDEPLVFSEVDKPQFINENTGETVIAYSGPEVDKRSDRSWARAIFKLDGGSPKHYHNERKEYYYVTAGQAKLIIDDVVSVLNPGEFVLIQPKQRHQVFSIGTEPLEMIVKCTPAWAVEDQIPA